MTILRYANNFSTTLDGGINDTTTSITLASASGLPSIGTNEQYYLTITDGSNIEIVLVTDDSSSPTLTVTRGQQGTSGTAFVDGDTVELRATVEAFDTPAIYHDINQSSHGLAVGDAVRLSGANTYTKAQADSAANAEVAGVVGAVADTDNFTLVTGGRIAGLSGLTANTVYFLDPSTAGALTSTEPSTANQVSKPVYIADSTTSAILLPHRGVVVGGKIAVSDLATGTDGELITWDASGNPTTVATGTSGHVLTSNGAGAAPTFQAASGGGVGATTDDIVSGDSITTATVATDDKVIIQDTSDSDNVKTVTAQSIADLGGGGGGAWNFLGAQTASTSASLDFESLIDSTYDTYVFVVEGVRLNNAAQSLCIRTSTDNGSTYDSSASDYHDSGMRVATSGTLVGFGTSTGTRIRISSDLGAETGADDTINGQVWMYNANNAATDTMFKFEVVYNHSTGSVCVTGAGKRTAVENVDAVQFLSSGGNLTSGTIRLYGISKS